MNNKVRNIVGLCLGIVVVSGVSVGLDHEITHAFGATQPESIALQSNGFGGEAIPATVSLTQAGLTFTLPTNALRGVKHQNFVQIEPPDGAELPNVFMSVTTWGKHGIP